MKRIFYDMKLFKQGKSFKITDQDNTPVYTIKQNKRFFKKKMTFYNEENEEVARMTYKFRGLLMGLEIMSYDKSVFTVKQKFSLRKKRYELDTGNIFIEGDIWGNTYTFYIGDDIIASICKNTRHKYDEHKLTVYDERFTDLITPVAIGVSALAYFDMTNFTFFI